ncbi:MAG TPA: alanine racemase [Solirubrobacteraceae bacterium]|nr:alanine racemase [Solirubrobacteraceae bacterium]
MRALARINVAAIERNSARLVRSSPRLCAVVKANAYGHGAVECARAALAGGATWLAVAAAQEAQELREGGLDAPILVMGALTRAELELALAVDADLVAWTEEFLDWVVALGGARVHVKLDSGMGRLGTRDGALADRLATRIAGTPGLELAGAMTHLATAEEPDRTFLEDQLARFSAWAGPLRERHPQLLVHAENSAALLGAGHTRFDMARCGGAVYGLDPFGVDPAVWGLEAALELRSWVAACKPCATGESVGYGRRFVASEPTDLAIVPIGYGDGVRRLLSNNAEVLVGGRRRPLVGTVSMDNLAVDLGRGSGVAVGTMVTLLGADGSERISAEEIAERQGTINYEVTCALSPRVPRAYHRDGDEEP